MSLHFYPISFLLKSWKIPGSSLYEATENELQGSGMKISKISSRVPRVTDLEIIACTPTSTLKLKLLVLKF